MQKIYLSGSYNKIERNAISAPGHFSSYKSYDIFSTYSNNEIYLNNFLTARICLTNNSTNSWNSTSPIAYAYNGSNYESYLGNHWADYSGLDGDGDGIGDTPYDTSSIEKDYYPLMDTFETYLKPLGYTETGENVTVNPDPNVSVSFSEVTEAGITTVETTTTNPKLEKTGFKFLNTYYNITTTANYTGPIKVCINYNDSDISEGREKNLKIFHWENENWTDVTTYLNTSTNVICGETYSFSWFAISYDMAPVADANGPYEDCEGSSITFDASASTDPDGDVIQYRWDFDNDGTWETNWNESPTASYIWNDNYVGTVMLEVSDGELTDTNTTTVTVYNVAPTLGEISAPVDPVQVNTSITTSATFTDPGIEDTHTAEWDWGDNSTSAGIVNEADGNVIGSHIYGTPGVYTVTLTVTDDDGGSDSAIFEYVVVYDPEGGFVTGGGFIDSPKGAYTADENLTGKAKFGFVSKYKKGADTPTGQTQFIFKVADLNFHSSEYEWLVIAGAHAKYKGNGTINGEGDYGFMLTATDGDIKGDNIDRFRIKIWDKTTEEVIYDNQMGDSDDADATDAIEGGSIVIHE